MLEIAIYLFLYGVMAAITVATALFLLGDVDIEDHLEASLVCGVLWPVTIFTLIGIIFYRLFKYVGGKE